MLAFLEPPISLDQDLVFATRFPGCAVLQVLLSHGFGVPPGEALMPQPN
ncbi:MAG: hypothetical protein JWP08_2385 [Bryobacterales bacterium]|nr:hypothetical protein [Bryobacterales bacterium]